MKSITELSHDYLKPVLHPQAICIDATLGRGRDARFFLQSGACQVIAYEVQEEPYMQSCRALSDRRFRAHLKSHAGMLEDYPQLKGKVDAVIFNFGYDPKNPSGPVSDPAESERALKQAIRLIRIRGRIALAFYPHPAGQKEKERLMEILRAEKGLSVLEISLPFKEHAPSLVCVEKTREDY